MAGASGPDTVSTRRRRIAELARQCPQMGFTSLNHHPGIAWMLAAFWGTRRDAAPGVGGRAARGHEAGLVANPRSLLDRAGSGAYRAPPVRRAHIPKGQGPKQTRPIGMPAPEGKTPQRAVAMALEPIYEQDSCDCSYGSRPGRPAHQALEDLWHQAMDLGRGDRGGPGPKDRPGTFDFLGFTHQRGKSKKGSAVVKRRTAASRPRRFARAIAGWCRENRHRPVREQHRRLRQKLQGHYGYHGITGNYAPLSRAKRVVAGPWREWLSRRSWEGRFPWATMPGLLGRLPLPAPRVVQSVYRSG